MKCLKIFYRALTAVRVYCTHTRPPPTHAPTPSRCPQPPYRTLSSQYSTYTVSPAHLCSSWSSFIPANWCCVVCKTARRAITLAANTHIAAQTGDEAEMKRRRLETVACLRNLRDVSAHHASLVYGIGGTMPLHADVYGT